MNGLFCSFVIKKSKHQCKIINTYLTDTTTKIRHGLNTHEMLYRARRTHAQTFLGATRRDADANGVVDAPRGRG